MDKNSTSISTFGGSSSTLKAVQPISDKSAQSEPSTLLRFVTDRQPHEQVAMGMSSERRMGEQLKDWDRIWEAASGSGK